MNERPAPQAANPERAEVVFTRLVMALGPGSHHLVLANGDRLATAQIVTTAFGAFGYAAMDSAETDSVTGLLAEALADPSPSAGLVSRTDGRLPGEPETLRGWKVSQGWLHPLTEAEVFSAYCTHPSTGEPISPEPGVSYRCGLDL